MVRNTVFQHLLQLLSRYNFKDVLIVIKEINKQNALIVGELLLENVYLIEIFRITLEQYKKV